MERHIQNNIRCRETKSSNNVSYLMTETNYSSRGFLVAVIKIQNIRLLAFIACCNCFNNYQFFTTFDDDKDAHSSYLKSQQMYICAFLTHHEHQFMLIRKSRNM
ncbi:hypothetical protein LOAG_06532 [Loa loa]|uniref:Uncharacterized protein n=1 Tax=Loa loa TaxID=7209 RepID=A0A1S0TXH6_LOALO|nr:hypothetical protein LOAG_06532 [Loa loa]EFO21956.1 hypothetical protein LOAG_06532 [Loa loa]